MKKVSRLMAIVVFIIVISTAVPAMSQYALLDIDVVEAGTNTAVSELTVDVEYEFRLWIENDVQMNGMQLGFLISSSNSATWDWVNAGGVGALGCVTVVPGSRMDGAFDLMPVDVMEREPYGLGSEDVANLRVGLSKVSLNLKTLSGKDYPGY